MNPYLGEEADRQVKRALTATELQALSGNHIERGSPYPVSIEKVNNGYICKIGCQTYVHEGRAETGLKKLLEYFERYEK